MEHCQRIVLAACLRAVVMVGEFGGHLPDPGGGFAIGDAAILWSRHGGAAGLLVGVGVGLECGGVGVITRWFAIFGWLHDGSA